MEHNFEWIIFSSKNFNSRLKFSPEYCIYKASVGQYIVNNDTPEGINTKHTVFKEIHFLWQNLCLESSKLK